MTAAMRGPSHLRRREKERRTRNNNVASVQQQQNFGKLVLSLSSTVERKGQGNIARTRLRMEKLAIARISKNPLP